MGIEPKLTIGRKITTPYRTTQDSSRLYETQQDSTLPYLLFHRRNRTDLGKPAMERVHNNTELYRTKQNCSLHEQTVQNNTNLYSTLII